MSCIKDRPLKKTKHRPTYKELPELFDLFGGNLFKVADYTGYSPRQVNYWITEADPIIKIGLMERLAAARLRQKRAVDLRPELPAFIIPSEIKALVSLFYRLSWDALLMLDIQDMLYDMDADPEKPPTLRYKMEWADLRDSLNALDAATSTIHGVGYYKWHQHVLMTWVGLNEQSPLWETYEALPEVTPEHTEKTLRALIKQLSKYL